MKIIFIIVVIICCFSCSNSNNMATDQHSDSVSTKIQSNERELKDILDNKLVSYPRNKISNTFILQEAINKTPEITELPFGSDIMVNHKFPDHWEHDYSDSEWKQSIDDQKLVDVSVFYMQLPDKKNTFKLPDFKNYAYFKIPYTVEINDSIPDFKKSIYFNYRLPDIGPYQSYYVGYSLDFNPSEFPRYMGLGYLLLYDKVKEKITVINIYNNVIDQYNTFNRFFYISKNYSIMLYDTTGNDTFFQFNAIHELQIDEQGKVTLKKTKYSSYNSNK